MTNTSMIACRARCWLLAAAVLGTACSGVREQQAGWAPRPPHPTLIGPPRAKASTAFRATWFDGTAELSGYRVTVPRYGELRTGELVLTYVTEPMNRTTRIKDYVRVSGDDHARLGERADELVWFNGIRAYMRMVDGHCGALRIEARSGAFVCDAYETRPQVCRDLGRGSGPSAKCCAMTAQRTF